MHKLCIWCSRVKIWKLLTFSVLVRFSFSQIMQTGWRMNLFFSLVVKEVVLAEALVPFRGTTCRSFESWLDWPFKRKLFYDKRIELGPFPRLWLVFLQSSFNNFRTVAADLSVCFPSTFSQVSPNLRKFDKEWRRKLVTQGFKFPEYHRVSKESHRRVSLLPSCNGTSQRSQEYHQKTTGFLYEIDTFHGN